MNENHIAKIAQETDIPKPGVEAVAALLEEGATVPFIARYRKEKTGSLDELAITEIRDQLARLAELSARQDAILKSLDQNGHLTEELEEKVRCAQTMAELEDIYLPYRPRRRTKATIAREKGLLPLAETIFAQTGLDPQAEAFSFIDPEKGVEDIESAVAGARDIIAEWINEDAGIRSGMREIFEKKATIRSRVAKDMEEKGAKFRDYFDWEEPLKDAPSHRILAMRRGENEEVLNLTIEPPEEEAISFILGRVIQGEGKEAEEVEKAARDAYKRLLSRSMETEMRLLAKNRADETAIRIFSDNLRELLLAPPLGAKRVLGIDPGFRTGCKVVCLDRQGKLIHHDTIYPHTGEKGRKEAAKTLLILCREYEIEAIAIGNGTAGRETEAFVKEAGIPVKIAVIQVNESGASIYSASEAARREFPDHDITVRGAVSIGRRLMDPLAELVKIDPKSIGVGQYQHDVDQSALKNSLDDIVTSCVNRVGVDLNRASMELLTYVSGLGPGLAQKIVEYRNENGPFPDRAGLKNVPRLGPKAFEQCAGFLRIPDGENPLDRSAVHPESYPIVLQMAGDLHCTPGDLMKSAALRSKIEISGYVTEDVGIPTLTDILEELAKPGRDPRQSFETVCFAEGVFTMEDLEPGMRIPGIVTNITAFGAFVDIGVHQDGLVHISEMADRFVKDPNEVVKVNQKVMVRVLELDIPRKRISLSLKPESQPKEPLEKAESGQTGTSKPGRKKPGTPKKEKNIRPPKDAPFNNPFADAFLRKK